MKLYGCSLSANYRKVAAVADFLAIEYQEIDKNVYLGAGQAGEYLAINSLGQIPTLVDDGFVLSESNAILVYLSDNYANKKLFGETTRKRSRVNQWLFWESSQWQPVLSSVMAAKVGHQLLPDVIAKPDKNSDWEAQDCVRQLTFLEKSLLNGWLLGEEVTLADFSVAAMTTYFRLCDFPWDNYPNIMRWYTELNEIESWKKFENALWK